MIVQVATTPLVSTLFEILNDAGLFGSMMTGPLDVLQQALCFVQQVILSIYESKVHTLFQKAWQLVICDRWGHLTALPLLLLLIIIITFLIWLLTTGFGKQLILPVIFCVVCCFQVIVKVDKFFKCYNLQEAPGVNSVDANTDESLSLIPHLMIVLVCKAFQASFSHSMASSTDTDFASLHSLDNPCVTRL